MKKIILGLKIALLGLFIGSSATHFLFKVPFDEYTRAVSPINDSANGLDKEGIILNNWHQLQKYSLEGIKKEISVAQYEQAHHIKIDDNYIKNKMPNYFQANVEIESIGYNLARMNSETNRFLVPKIGNQYQLPTNLNDETNFNYKNISILSDIATKNKEYLLNYYKNKNSSENAFTIATIVATPAKEINLASLNQQFNENLSMAEELNNLGQSQSYKDINESKLDLIEKEINFINTHLDKFLDNALTLNLVKNSVNHDNYQNIQNYAILALIADLLFFVGMSLPILGFIYYFEHFMAIGYLAYKDIKYAFKRKNLKINYKRTKSENKSVFKGFIKERGYRKMSYLGLISSLALMSSISLAIFDGQINFHWDDSIAISLFFVHMGLMTNLVFTGLKNFDFKKELDKIEQKHALIINLKNKSNENEEIMINTKIDNTEKKVLKAFS